MEKEHPKVLNAISHNHLCPPALDIDGNVA